MQEQDIRTKRYFFPLPIEHFETRNVVGVELKARIRIRCSQFLGPDPGAGNFSYGSVKNPVTSVLPDVRRLSRGTQWPGVSRPLRLRDP